MTSPQKPMARAERFTESLCICAGLAVMSIVWAFAVGAWLAFPTLSPLAAVVTSLAAVALFCAVHLRTPAQREGVRLRRPALPVWAMAAAVVSFMALKLSFDTLLLSVVPDQGAGPVTAWLRGGGGWAPILLSMVLLAPMVEEVGFRGWMQTWLERRYGPTTAVLAGAVAFAAAHFNPWGFPSMLLGGLVLGYAFRVSGSLWPSMLLHVAANATVALSVAGLPFGVGDAAVLLLPSAAVLAWLGIRFRAPGCAWEPGSTPTSDAAGRAGSIEFGHG